VFFFHFKAGESYSAFEFFRYHELFLPIKAFFLVIFEFRPYSLD